MSTGSPSLQTEILDPIVVGQGGQPHYEITPAAPRGEPPDIWDQVRQVLHRSMIAATGPAARQPHKATEGVSRIVVVAPGMAMSEKEFEARFGAIDLDAIRIKMSPELFAAYVRFLGVIPGGANLDVTRITTIED